MAEPLKTAKRAARRGVINFNRALGRYDNPVWLIGDGRSGTTWTADLINADGKMRELFEPFHPLFGRGLNGMPPNLYVRPGADGGAIDGAARRIFSGEPIGGRIDRRVKRGWHDGLLIKDVFSNLLAAWAVRRFSLRRTVLLARNPFAVAVSKYRKRDWFWMTDPADFLKQPDLVEDHLAPYAEVLARAEDDYLVNQVKIWAVLHLAPLRQFNADEICIVVYEDLVENFEAELRRISAHLWDRGFDDRLRRAMKIVARPSATSGADGPLSEGLSPVDGWRSEIRDDQMARGLAALEAFGLRDLVDASGRPIRRAFERRLASAP